MLFLPALSSFPKVIHEFLAELGPDLKSRPSQRCFLATTNSKDEGMSQSTPPHTHPHNTQR